MKKSHKKFFYPNYFAYISIVIKKQINMSNPHYEHQLKLDAMKKHTKLSSRNKTLLLMGAKTTGSFTEGYYYIEESLYLDEADELHTFCMWIDNQIGGAGPVNIDMLWLGFKYPEVDKYSLACVEIKKQMHEIKSYC